MKFLAVIGFMLWMAADTHAAAGEPSKWEQIDEEARRLMASEDVKGMALAVIEDGQVVLQALLTNGWLQNE